MLTAGFLADYGAIVFWFYDVILPELVGAPLVYGDLQVVPVAVNARLCRAGSSMTAERWIYLKLK